MAIQRRIQSVINAHPTSDGEGVKIRRVAGFDNPNFSPFLMIDELKSDNQADYVGGFPTHPHRGIETLTYMLEGHFQHKDHMGNVGELKPGGAQWMAAGRGVLHSEMPIMESGQLHGFQIWINQPSQFKMSPSQYADFQADTIPEYRGDSIGKLRVIAGEVEILGKHSFVGPVSNSSATFSLSDWQAGSQKSITLTRHSGDSVMLFAYNGNASVGQDMINEGQLAFLGKGDELKISTSTGCGLLIFTGAPIDEKIVHYGPFVMNSAEEIEQAIRDYNQGVFHSY